MHRFAALILLVLPLLADGPADNLADKVRPVPPPGISVPAAERVEIESELAALGRQIEELRAGLKDKPKMLSFLPDVEIFHKAVQVALQHNEFYKTNEFEIAHSLLLQGTDRARQLALGRVPWLSATGLVVRGYKSKIDHSIQPYGLVVPPSFQTNSAHRYRLDAWFHGRGETLTELAFLNERQRSPGEFVPPNAFVLHLYGRYCNANKFAGEIDLFEALDHVRQHYPIDDNRVAMRGFSMGGAACWQFAVHYAGRWAAAAPGAGFSETADFLKIFQNEKVQPAWYEQKLWHWYDCTDYALNLFHCPTVAYSGENDRQKQAADIMAKALAAEGMELTHLIGPKTGHIYHPDTKREINARIDSIVARGRNPVPRKVRFTTWTLRYHEMLWVTLDGLEEHWERAQVEAEIVDDRTVRLSTKNVSALTLSMPPGLCPLDPTQAPRVILDGRTLTAPRVQSDRSWTAHFRKEGKRWNAAPHGDAPGLRKRHGLQGPIDDAFMDSFIMVEPTGQPLHEKTGAWAAAEMKHAINHWRKQFRGDARVKKDTEISDDDIASSHLVLWGDPQSNRLLARLAAQLPISWDGEKVRLGKKELSAAHHVPVLIYPNPLNPRRYVVLNSGFTFREYDYLNNARQIAKLPDFAVVDVNKPMTSRLPGGIAAAGFFDEQWRLREVEGR
ncbi:MAG: prolyl oligopeptidase family serine peptidase [Verrucomicrobiota bacterium]